MYIGGFRKREAICRRQMRKRAGARPPKCKGSTGSNFQWLLKESVFFAFGDDFHVDPLHRFQIHRLIKSQDLVVG